MPEQPNQPGKNLVDLKTIWTHYVWLSSRTNVGEDEKSKWLDIFLCRAISELAKLPTNTNKDGRQSLIDDVSCNFSAPGDAFLKEFCHNIGTTSTNVASRLVAILAMELRHLCLCFETYKDVRPLKRYVFEGRGWKILYLLNRIEIEKAMENNWISNLNPTSAAKAKTDLTIKDLVELLLNLFQVRLLDVPIGKKS
jgi:hypothetical protein